MSLSSLLRERSIVDLIKPLRPQASRRLDAPMRAGPLSKRYAMVGTAFDYLLRFELQRRSPGVQASRWVAELAPLLMYDSSHEIISGDLRGVAEFDADHTRLRITEVLQAARAALDAHQASVSPTRVTTEVLATHAIKLAKLDVLRRAGYLDPAFDEAAPEDVQDLLHMMDLVPYDALLNRGELVLNPVFGLASRDVGGADADLLCGNALIDIKVTVKPEVGAPQLDQLLGYFLLAREHRRAEPSFREIKEVGLYFARQAHLWTMPATAWTNHPDFGRIEGVFIERARALSKPPATARELVQSLVDLGYTHVLASAGPSRAGGRSPPFPLRILRDERHTSRASGSNWRVVLPSGLYAVGTEGSVDMASTEARDLVRSNPGAKLVKVQWRRRKKIRTRKR